MRERNLGSQWGPQVHMEEVLGHREGGAQWAWAVGLVSLPPLFPGELRLGISSPEKSYVLEVVWQSRPTTIQDTHGHPSSQVGLGGEGIWQANFPKHYWVPPSCNSPHSNSACGPPSFPSRGPYFFKKKKTNKQSPGFIHLPHNFPI